MTWTWNKTRWILDLHYDRQFDIEHVNERQYKLWYRRNNKDSLLIGLFHKLEEAKATGTDIAKELLHKRKYDLYC